MIDLAVLAASSDPPPAANNVVAGWVGAVVMVSLIIAVVLILRSFTKQLKKVNAAEEAGVFGDAPDGTDGSRADSDQPSGHPQG
jgi:hypothetical protein